MSTALVNPLTARDIWKSYTEDRPNPGGEYEQWVAEKAAEFGYPPKAVKKVIAGELHALQMYSHRHRTTEAQRIAHAAGLTLVKTFAVLNRMLDAKKTRREYYKGELVDEWEETDNAAQNFAVRTAVQVFGAAAPQQINVEHDIGEDLARVTDADLKLRLMSIFKEVGIAGDVIDTTAEPVGGAVGAGSEPSEAGVAVPAGASGPLLLADKPHQNKGRAGGQKRSPVRKRAPLHVPGGDGTPGAGGESV